MAADKTLGEILHEAREAGNDGRDRPMFLAPWADRDPRLKMLDEAMAEAVAAEVRERMAATPGGELVRQAWVFWALEQPDVAEHPNWVKSWAELDERDREADDRIYTVVAEVVKAEVRGRFGHALRDHYLAGIARAGVPEQCNPVCACSAPFRLYPSTRRAVDAWIEHVMEVASEEADGG